MFPENIFHFRVVLIEQLSPNFSSFFSKKNGKSRKAGKTGNISKVWKFNRGQNIWKASHSNVWEKKMESFGNTKNCAIIKSGNLDEKSFDKNGPFQYLEKRMGKNWKCKKLRKKKIWKFRQKVLRQERP